MLGLNLSLMQQRTGPPLEGTPSVAISTSRTAIAQGEGVVMWATVTGISNPADALRYGEFVFSASASSAEKDDFSALVDAVDHRCPAISRGESNGGYAFAHVYRTAGTHTISMSMIYNGTTYDADDVTITVTDEDTAWPPATATAAWSPSGNFTGIPAGLPVSRQYTTFADAKAWIEGANGRRLLLRGGEEYVFLDRLELTRVAQRIATYGTGRAIVRLDPLLLPLSGNWYPFGTGDGSTTVFTSNFGAVPTAGAGQTERVDVGGVVQGAGFSFNAGRTELTFTTAPADGAHIFVTLFGDAGWKYRPVINFRSNDSSRQSVYGLDIRGDYDPDNPTTFDGISLGGLNRGAGTLAIALDQATPDCTIDNVRISGVRAGIAQGGEEGARGGVISDVRVTDWQDYAWFSQEASRMGCVGCSFEQSPTAARALTNNTAGGAKQGNEVGMTNFAAHNARIVRSGPISEPTAIVRTHVYANGGWSAGSNPAGPRALQPAWRINTVQSYAMPGWAMSECSMANNGMVHTKQGEESILAPGACVLANSIITAGGGAGAFIADDHAEIIARNTVMILQDEPEDGSTDGNFVMLGAAKTEMVSVPTFIGARTINAIMIISASRPTRTLTVSVQDTLPNASATRPAWERFNTPVIIEGDWATVEATEGGAAFTPDVLATVGPLGELGQPRTGAGVLGAASGARITPVDIFGAARPASEARGPFEAAADVSGIAAPPTVRFPMDDVPLLETCGFAMKRLNRSYTGPILRTAGGVDVYPGPGGWVNVDHLLDLADGGNLDVDICYDPSGFARNSVQTVAARRPRIVSAGVLEAINGRPALLFGAGTSRALEAPTPFLRHADGLAVSAVAEVDSDGAFQWLWQQPVDNVAIYSPSIGDISMFAGLQLASGAFPSGGFVVSAIFNEASSSIGIDGVWTDGNAGTTRASANSIVGNASGYAGAWRGRIASFMQFGLAPGGAHPTKSQLATWNDAASDGYV